MLLLCRFEDAFPRRDNFTFAIGAPGLPGVVTATPGANGIATVTFAIPAGSNPGQYTILATFPGDQTIDSAVGTGSLTIPAGRTTRRWNR